MSQFRSMNPPPQLALSFPVTEQYTFQTFLDEPWNTELITRLRSPLEDKGPLVIWGARGSGRTHLLQALCHEHDDAVYVPLASMMEDYPPAILEGLESISLICIDDLDRLSPRRDWQEAVFALFNSVREHGGCLVMTADNPPRQLSLALEDLRSRLSWGSIYQLHPLSEAGKSEVLRMRAEQRGIELGEDIRRYILQRSRRDIHALLGVLDTLDQLSLVEKRRITIPFVRGIMGW